jgi:hypothetical protein
MNLHNRINVNGQGSARVVAGWDFAYQARKGNATKRALLAVETIGADLYGLTAAQATALAKANRTYVAELRRMTDLERAAVLAGRIKLSDRVNHRNNKPVTDGDLDKLIAEIGIDRVFASLDRITRPVAA